MRVLMLQDWNPGHGGAEAYSLWLREGLRQAGDEVRLLTSSTGSVANGTADFTAFATDSKPVKALLQIANPFAAAAVEKAVRSFRPDVAWVNMFALYLSPSALAALGSVPFVLAASDYKLICPMNTRLLPDGRICGHKMGWVCYSGGCQSLPHWLRDQPRYKRIREAAGRARRILACSEWVRDELARFGINADSFPPPLPPAGETFVRCPSPDPVFFFSGRIEVEKGVQLLLRAFARLLPDYPRASLRIAGQGSRQDELRALAAALGIAPAVHFLGWLPPAKIESELKTAWAAVVPSLWAEPFGLVAGEAVIRGVPVVASAHGGLMETVTAGRTGLLFPAGDEERLLGCLRSIASGQEFPRHALSADASGEIAERFSVHDHVQRLREILKAAGGLETAGPATPSAAIYTR